MSNTIDHDEFSDKIEKLFSSVKTYFNKVDGVSDETLKHTEIRITGTPISFCDGNLIHLDVDKNMSISVLKDSESRTFKIIRVSDEDNVYPTVIAEANISDDPAIKVYVGNSSFECSDTMREIVDNTKKINNMISLYNNSFIAKKSPTRKNKLR